MNIEKMLINYNFSVRKDTVKYIVIHDTGNQSAGAGVKAHFNFFDSGNRNASADYFVDDKIIGQFIEDGNKSWHCGDGAGKYGITNDNSVGIEICINSDGDYSKAVQNAVELTKFLMKKYNLPSEKVVRHYDASRKSCPNTMMANDWELWKKFKSLLTDSTKPIEPPKVETPKIPNESIKKDWVYRLQAELNNQGFKDSNDNRLVVDGIAGPLTLSACPVVKKGADGNITKLIQEKVGCGTDGIFGVATRQAVIKYQKSKGLVADGIVGKNTWAKLLNL